MRRSPALSASRAKPRVFGSRSMLYDVPKSSRGRNHAVMGGEMLMPACIARSRSESGVVAEGTIPIAGRNESEWRVGSIAAQIPDGGDVPPHRRRLERTEDQTAAVTPCSGATSDRLRGIVGGNRRLQERDAVVVSVGVHAGEMNLVRRPARETGQQSP